PAAWDENADQKTYKISDDWMAQVKKVVDFCIKDSLFVVLNIHWDGGWLETKIDDCVNDAALREKISAKQGAYWKQIATEFRDYDYHLLFAGTNEPNVKDAASYEVLKSFLQIFIDTVRATGGNNASRTLIVQGPNTDIEKTYQLMNTLPTDKIADRMMAEVHFYPYQFTLMEQDADWGKVFYYWGKNNHSSTDTDRNPTWGEEAFVDSVFGLMKTKFVDKGIPVLLGEFGAVKRMTLTGESLNLLILSRRCFYEYVALSAKKHGLVPVAWDAGGKGDLTMTIFDRKTGGVYDLGLLNAIRSGWGLRKLDGDTSLVQVAKGNKSLKALYSAKDSLWGQVNLGVAKKDMTSYESITVRAYVNGETKYDSLGTMKNGYVALTLVTMSDNWTWRDAPFGTVAMNEWDNYTIPISSDTADEGALVPADP
ncbi:MAG: cellulase family glycosylhydrolase, partial [Fibrobacter sp.]|nr:cellulase family glycosylhydrolase [Fibrobacter sp.]